MKKIILIIILFMSISTFAKEGNIDISVNGGISSGSGFGLTYGITDELRIKLASIYLGLSSNNKNYYSVYTIGGSISLDIKKLRDKISSVYIFLGTNHLGIKDSMPIHLYGAGLGLRKFIDEKLFVELEFGYALYHIEGSDEVDYKAQNTTFVTGSLNLGYQF